VKLVQYSLFALVVSGCPGPYEEACSAADLAKIERSYQAELALHCAAQGTNCTNKPAIDAKYRAKREAWVRCDKESQ
jgi:hypothetical protein